jgi:PhzF family phenazine biosynthesis protein
MSTRIVQVDAFTDIPFRGNPAAVALFEDLPDDQVLQNLALEMNLSETAFPIRRADGHWDLRWFTPATEVDLCGHATLASAHVLFELGLVTTNQITFHTRSGLLTCRQDGLDIVMDFPTAAAEPCGPVDGLADALGAPVLDQGRSFDLLAQLDSPRTVADLQPDLSALARFDTLAVVVTAAGDINGGPAHFVSRVFAPRVGIPEDPVTGSAHCITGPWWAKRLGTTDLEAHQVSARGGRLGVRIRGDRVELVGRAVTILDGTLCL